MRDELLNETLFLSMAHARLEISSGVENYNQDRRHSLLGYEAPAAFAAKMDKQWLASLSLIGPPAPAIAATVHMRNKAVRP